MSNKIPVHLITLLVIDHDKLGQQEAKHVLENARYPNHCMHPAVLNVRTVETEWTDEHPLNRSTTRADELMRMFPNAPAIEPHYSDSVRLEESRSYVKAIDSKIAAVTAERDKLKAELASVNRSFGECDTERCEALTLLNAARKLAQQREAGESDAREAAALEVVARQRAERDLASFTTAIRQALGMDEYKAPEQLIQRMRVIAQAWELKPTATELEGIRAATIATGGPLGAAADAYINRVIAFMEIQS